MLFLRLNNAKKIRKLYFMSKNEYFVLKLLFFLLRFWAIYINHFQSGFSQYPYYDYIDFTKLLSLFRFWEPKLWCFINVILHPLVFFCIFIRLCLFLFLWLISALWLHIFSRLYLIILGVLFVNPKVFFSTMYLVFCHNGKTKENYYFGNYI